MELKKYINKKVKVDLINGYYYEGVVKSADGNSISLKDKFGADVDIREKMISFIKELAG